MCFQHEGPRRTQPIEPMAVFLSCTLTCNAVLCPSENGCGWMRVRAHVVNILRKRSNRIGCNVIDDGDLTVIFASRKPLPRLPRYRIRRQKDITPRILAIFI